MPTDSNKKVLNRPVFLIGFMGAGKTSVARRLARNFGISAVDLDTYIERSVGKSIPQIFDEVGEAGFRKIETDVLREVSSSEDPSIISCGGGIVTTPENCDIMRDAGMVLHLKVTADEAAARISNKSSRPLFNDIESARTRCAARMPLYEAAADETVETGGRSVGAITADVADVLEKAGVLCQLQE